MKLLPIVAFLAASNNACGSDDLNFEDYSHVSLLMRHGARTPLWKWFGDDEVWPFQSRPGRLTSVGTLQARLIGGRLYNMFSQMGLTDITSDQFRLVSTKESRTISTAEAVVDGWFYSKDGLNMGFGDLSAPPKKHFVDTKIYVAGSDDPVIRPYKVYGDVIKPEVKKNRNSPYFKNILKSLEKEFEFIAQWSNFTESSKCKKAKEELGDSNLVSFHERSSAFGDRVAYRLKDGQKVCHMTLTTGLALSSYVYARSMHDVKLPLGFRKHLTDEELEIVQKGLAAGSKFGKIMKHWGQAGEYNAAPLLGEMFAANLINDRTSTRFFMHHCNGSRCEPLPKYIDERGERNGVAFDREALKSIPAGRLYFAHDSLITAFQLALGVSVDDFSDPFYGDMISFHTPKKNNGCWRVFYNLVKPLKTGTKFRCENVNGSVMGDGWVDSKKIRAWATETVRKMMEEHTGNELAAANKGSKRREANLLLSLNSIAEFVRRPIRRGDNDKMEFLIGFNQDEHNNGFNENNSPLHFERDEYEVESENENELMVGEDASQNVEEEDSLTEWVNENVKGEKSSGAAAIYKHKTANDNFDIIRDDDNKIHNSQNNVNLGNDLIYKDENKYFDEYDDFEKEIHSKEQTAKGSLSEGKKHIENDEAFIFAKETFAEEIKPVSRTQNTPENIFGFDDGIVIDDDDDYFYIRK